MTEEVKQKVYGQMIGELDARINPLVEERKQYERAAQRIAEIDVELEVLRAERAEYDVLVPKTDAPKFDR